MLYRLKNPRTVADQVDSIPSLLISTPCHKVLKACWKSTVLIQLHYLYMMIAREHTETCTQKWFGPDLSKMTMSDSCSPAHFDLTACLDMEEQNAIAEGQCWCCQANFKWYFLSAVQKRWLPKPDDEKPRIKINGCLSAFWTDFFSLDNPFVAPGRISGKLCVSLAWSAESEQCGI